MLRPVGRAVLLAIAILLTWTLFYTLEPRKTAYSCRTLSSCVGLGNSHKYNPLTTNPIDTSSVETGLESESESELRDGTIRFDRRFSGPVQPDMLILVLYKDGASWSSDFRSRQRTVFDFLDLLAATRLDLAHVSLAVLTSSEQEYRILKEATTRLPFGRCTIFFRKDRKQDDGDLAYKNRHDPSVQLARRSSIAKLRNYLMLRALEDEREILWIDADVVEVSPNLVQTMMGLPSRVAGAGIVTARCRQNQMENYDKNAWKLSDTFPNLRGPIADGDRDLAVHDLVATRHFIPELTIGTSDNDAVPLDSVGGTTLYIRAELVREGLTFPTQNIVGTTWDQAGWIGVETEGLCYAARSFQGGDCYVLGGNHWARHSDWG